MNPNTKLATVIEVLKKQGLTEEQVIQFCQGITEAGYNQIYTESMAQFTDADMTALDACADQTQANVLIIKLFEERTGQKVEDRLAQYIDSFCDNFLREMQKNNPS